MKYNVYERIEKHIEKACEYSAKMVSELGKIQNLLIFKGFEEHGLTPEVQICGGDEIIVVCNGYELLISCAIEEMNRKGFIEPIDFCYDLTLSFRL